jgi:AraC family transcriptional regulator
MIKHTIFAIGLGMLIFFLYLFQYTGAFKSVTVAVDQRPQYTVIYKDFTGPYHKIVNTIEEVEKWVKSHGLSCRLSFGEYFDDPRQIEEGRLKSRGGCLLDPQRPDEEKILANVKNQFPEDFKLGILPATEAVIALFTGAPGIGPLKVYPKAEEFISENKLKRKGSVIEIYEVFDQQSMQTIYMWPIIR